MKIQEGENYFLATNHCAKDDLLFLIEQKSDWTRVSTLLAPEHAKQLRDEIDFWLKQIGEQAEGMYEQGKIGQGCSL